MKNKFSMLLKSFGAIFLVLFFSSIFFNFFNIDSKKISDKMFVVYLAIADIVLLGIFVLIYYKTLKKDFIEFKNNFNEIINTSFKYWGVGFLVMIVSNLIIFFILKRGLAGNEESIRHFLDAAPIIMIILTSICAPINEELAFRKSTREAISNKYVYVLFSGILFGLVHIISYVSSPIDFVYLIPYSALGIAFALLYYKTNNIFSSISMHAFHNTLAVVIYLLGASL